MININKLLESSHLEVTFADTTIDRFFVKSFRKEHGLTQIALANILGVTKKTIEKWEQGRNCINGSSSVLLKLLSDNPELLQQLYRVKTQVVGKCSSEEYTSIEKTTLRTSSSSSIASKLLFAAII